MGHDRKKDIESIVPYNISFSGDNKKNIFLGGLLFVFIFFGGGGGLKMEQKSPAFITLTDVKCF